MKKKPRRSTYALRLSGRGSDVRLRIDQAAAEHLLAWIGANLGAAPGVAPAQTSTSLAQMDPNQRHAFHHQHAPGALRELYRDLCDDLLDDAQEALDEEKKRRENAS